MSVVAWEYPSGGRLMHARLRKQADVQKLEYSQMSPPYLLPYHSTSPWLSHTPSLLSLALLHVSLLFLSASPEAALLHLSNEKGNCSSRLRSVHRLFGSDIHRHSHRWWLTVDVSRLLISLKRIHVIYGSIANATSEQSSVAFSPALDLAPFVACRPADRVFRSSDCF